jgi:hypothetical protein
MSRRRIWLVCALAATTSPRVAQALDANATAGIGYGRWDSWAAGLHTSSSFPDWQLAADFSGHPFRPGLLEWRAGGDYQAIRTYTQGQGSSQESTKDGWGLHLQSALLSGTPLPITISAGRAWTDFSTDTTSKQTGVTLTNSLTTAIILRLRSYPTLRLQGTWLNTENTAIGGVNTSMDSKTVNAGLSHTAGTHTYAIDYSTAWSSGNFAINNYRSDYLNAQFTSAPTENVMIRFREYYLLRNPTNDAPRNPRFDDTSMSSGIQYRPGQRWNSSLDYNFRHSLITAAGAPKSEQTTHAIDNITYFRYRPTLSLFGTAGVGFSTENLDDTHSRAGNQSLGGGVNWQLKFGRTSFLTSGNGRIAGLEVLNQPFALGYGVGGSGGVTHARERLSLSLQYNVAYSSNAVGVGGTTSSQMVQGITEGVVGRGTYLRGSLSYTNSRREDPILGLSETYTFTAMARAAWRRWDALWTVDFSGGQSDGLAGSLANPTGAPAPLAAPSSYNTRSRYATLQLSQILLRGKLTFNQLFRVLSMELPEQPSQYEEAAIFTIRYTIGAMNLTLDDRLSRGGTTGPSQTSNLIMLRLSRNFGANF